MKQQQQELITEVETHTKEAQERLMKDKTKYQDQLKEWEETVSQVTRLLKRSTGAELVRTKTSVDELFQVLHEPQEMPSSFDKKFLKAVFMENQEISHRLQEEKFGHFGQTSTEVNQSSVESKFQDATAGLVSYFEVITRNSKGEQCYCPGDYISVNIAPAQGTKAAVNMRMVDRTDGSYEVTFIPGEAGQHVVTARINGENLTEFLSIDVNERTFKSVTFIGGKSIDKRCLDHPWGVTVNNSNEIFVSDLYNNRILVFTEKGQFIRSFGQDLVNGPKGISIDNEGRIFVVNSGNNIVLLFNSNGEYIKTLNSDGLLMQPRGICLGSQGNLVVCDSGNKCVRFISGEGNNFKTIGKGWLRMPYDCLCYEDKIFVSDHDAHLVKVYSKEGRFLHHFGRYGFGDGELNHPTGLAVDKTGHLLICSADSHRVQVFTLDGKFVGKFGKNGEGLGQLLRPTSVAVLKSGRIVVCELQNNRLQVFA